MSIANIGTSLARIFDRKNSEGRVSPRINQRHGTLVDLNATVNEYAKLLEKITSERAELLKTISLLRLENAELSVGKALFAELETELTDIRHKYEEAAVAIQDRRTLERELTRTRQELKNTQEEAVVLQSEISSLKEQLTKTKTKKRGEGS